MQDARPERAAKWFIPVKARLDAFAATDHGRKRENNEDSYYSVYQDSHAANYPIATKGALFIVASGMGNLGGRRASQLALQIVPQYFYEAIFGDPRTDLVEAILEANRKIYLEQINRSDMHDTCTTVTAGVIVGNQLFVAHVGNSRAYLLRGGQLTGLTKDHSLVEEMVAQGLLSPQEATNHPQRNVIARALGAKPEIVVDTWSGEWQSNDVLLLCSDSLSDVVTFAELTGYLTQARSVQEIAQRLINQANARGAADNVTAVVIRG